MILERLVLEDLLTDDMQLDRKKIAKHIYEHRKTMSRKTISSFYIYAEVMPEIKRLLNVLKDYDTKHDVIEVSHKPTIVEAIQEQTKILIETIEKKSVPNVSVAGDLVITKHVDNEVANVSAGGIGIKNNKE